MGKTFGTCGAAGRAAGRGARLAAPFGLAAALLLGGGLALQAAWGADAGKGASDAAEVDLGLEVDMGDEGYETVYTNMGRYPAGAVRFSFEPSDDALSAYQEAMGDSGLTKSDMLQAWVDGITSVSIDGVQLEGEDFDVWKNELTNVEDDAGTLLYYDATASSSYARIWLPIALFDTDHAENQLDTKTLVIESEGFATTSGQVTYRNIGSDVMVVRVIDEDSGEVLYSYTLDDEDLKSLEVQERYSTTANCGMAGLRSYTSEGVLLTDVLEAAGVDFGEGMTLELRMNDYLDENGDADTTDTGYSSSGEFTYEELMADRYYYANMWDDETSYEELDGRTVYDVLAEEGADWSYCDYSDALFEILGEDVVQVEPIIAWSWAEGVVGWGGSDTTQSDYNGYCDQFNYRLLFGMTLDEDGNATDEATTFSNCYAVFGIDIIADESAISEDGPGLEADDGGDDGGDDGDADADADADAANGIDLGLAVDMGDEGWESTYTAMGRYPQGMVRFSLYPSDDALADYQEALGDSSITTEEMLQDWIDGITSVSIDGVQLDDKAFDEWKSELTNAADDAGKLLYYEAKASSSCARLYLPVALFDTDQSVNITDTKTIVIRSEGFATVSDQVTYRNMGSDSITVRVIDEDTSEVLYSYTFDDEDLKALPTQERYLTTANCGMAGLRTFCSEGVLLTDLLDAAGVEFGEGMTLRMRTNDCLEEDANGDEDTVEDGYYSKGTFSYEYLMEDRYCYANMWDDETTYEELDGRTVYDVLSDVGADWSICEYTDALFEILGEGAEQVEPLISWASRQGVIGWGGVDPSTLDYDGYSDQGNYNLVFGMELDEDGKATDETTTYSNCGLIFGIDIIADEDAIAEDAPGLSEEEDDADGARSYFTDVPESASGLYYFDAVYALADLGYITGNVDGSYGIGEDMTRAQFVTILWRMACPEDYEAYEYDAGNESGLSDVADGKYYTAAINWAVENGVVTGYSNGKFGVNDAMSFQDMCLIIARYAGAEDGSYEAIGDSAAAAALADFSDGGSVSAYARRGMAWCVGEGLVSGNTDGSLAPQEEVSRERVAVVLWRAIEGGIL